jgi:hypothetical protein
MRLSSYISVLLIAAVHSAAAGSIDQQVALAPGAPDCPFDEPDSVQISWVAPCEDGNWLFDTETGCRMWDWHPALHDKATWSGACLRGVKEGPGVVQWTEHGLPIDRFEGTYRNGRREGFGRYRWNATDRFEGLYANDLPHGLGTAHLAGETFAGDWQNGCMTKGERVVAIAVPRRTCAMAVSLLP